MSINTNSTHTAKEIFDKYTDDSFDFARTHVLVRLVRYGDEQLISRSQAKRVVASFEKFKEILLNFAGVDQIGRAFADEIFRVFSTAHPEIIIVPTNTSPQIEAMIKHVAFIDRASIEK